MIRAFIVFFLTAFSSFAFAAGNASRVIFAIQPGSAIAGAPFKAQPVVLIVDADGALVTEGPDATAVVTLALSENSPTSGELFGTLAITATRGVAVFTNISAHTIGRKILIATKADTSAQERGSPSVTTDSTQFNVGAGAAHHLSFISQPQNARAGTALAPVQVAVVDVYGNVVQEGAGSSLVLEIDIYNNSTGAVLEGTRAASAVNGVTTFSGLSVDKILKNVRLVVSEESLGSAVSNSFNITR